jgi:ABC-2 type transport system ATP-binding protein
MLKEININKLSKKYKNATSFSLIDINFKILAGSTHGILGSNGAGKSTLIKIICDVLIPTNGTVDFLDSENQKIKREEIKSIIGYVPQDFAFFDELSIKQNFIYFGTMYNLQKAEIINKYEEMIHFLKLEDHQQKKIKLFSGGMKRKVNLALGLLHNPEVIILDEPTVGIDIRSKADIIDHLKQLNHQGKTIIYTSHQMKEAQDFCSHVSLFNEGKMIVSDKMENVLQKMNQEDLESLLLTF